MRRRNGAAPQGNGLNDHPRSAQPGWADRHFYHLMVAPAVVAMAALVAFPLVYTIWLSLTEWVVTSGRPPRFIGAGNFVALASDPDFWQTVWRTAMFVGLGVSLQVPIGVGLALLLHRQFFGRGVARTLTLLPMMATPAAVGLVWGLMMEPTLGVLNEIIGALGLPASAWTSSPKTVIFALVLVDTWQWSPLIALFCLSGLAVIPDEPYEAARIDGATPLQEFVFITLPSLRPILITAILFRAINSLKTFDLIYVMTQGGPGRASETTNMFAFVQGFHYFNMGYSSTIIVVFVLMMLAVSVMLLRVRER